MEWSVVLEDKSLQDLPYKIELNRQGQIVMSPATNWHANHQGKIIKLLNALLTEGHVFPECSVQTDDNVKVADVVWASDAFIAQHGWQTPYTVAPEICVEVKSPGNSKDEIARKRDLYLGRGAKEFWVCDEFGSMTFYDASGMLTRSKLVGGFPEKV